MTPKQLEKLGLTRDSVWHPYNNPEEQYTVLHVANVSSQYWSGEITVVFQNALGDVFTISLNDFADGSFERVW